MTESHVVIHGLHTVPAMTGDPACDELPPKAYGLWLGSNVKRRRGHGRYRGVTRSNLAEAVAAIKQEQARQGVTSVTITLSAPLRFHRNTWWACGATSDTLHIFHVVDLLYELHLGRDVAHRALVHPAHGWHGFVGAVPVDVPDRRAVEEWQAELAKRDAACECLLGSADDRYMPHRRPSTLTGIPRCQSDQLLTHYPTLNPNARKLENHLLLVSAKTAQSSNKGEWPWSRRLRDMLGALGRSCELWSGHRPNKVPDIVCALENEVLYDGTLRDALGACSDGQLPSVLLLDRVSTLDDDEFDRWRLRDALRRGAWRPLDQAIWLSQYAPKSPAQESKELEGVRLAILNGFRQLCRGRHDAWSSIVGTDMQWLSSDACLEELLKRSIAELCELLESVLSIVAGSDLAYIRETGEESCLHPAFAELLRNWRAAWKDQLAPLPEDFPSRMRLPEVWLTFEGQAQARKTFDRLLAVGDLFSAKLSINELAEPGDIRVPDVEYWFHVINHGTPPDPRLSAAFQEARARGIGVVCGLLGGATARPDVPGVKTVIAPEPLDLGDLFVDAFRDAIRPQRAFISYSSRDRATVKRLVAALERRGISCWLDIRQATSGKVKAGLHAGVKNCQAVVVMLSQAALESDWVNYEMDQAKALGRGLCPLELEPGLREEFHRSAGVARGDELQVIRLHGVSNDETFSERMTMLVKGLVGECGVVPDPRLIIAAPY